MSQPDVKRYIVTLEASDAEHIDRYLTGNKPLVIGLGFPCQVPVAGCRALTQAGDYGLADEGVIGNVRYVTVLDDGDNPVEYEIPEQDAIDRYGCEPWCSHDEPAIAPDGICECGIRVRDPGLEDDLRIIRKYNDDDEEGT